VSLIGESKSANESSPGDRYYDPLMHCVMILSDSSLVHRWKVPVMMPVAADHQVTVT